MSEYKPEIGVECEGKFQELITCKFKWQKCTPIHQERNEWAVKAANGGRLCWCDEFRAIVSPEDEARARAIEEMLSCDVYSTSEPMTSRKEYAEMLYDKDYRKMQKEVAPVDFAYMVDKMFNAYPPAIDQLIRKLQKHYVITLKGKS